MIYLTERELELAEQALARTAEDLRQYTKWIDDQPMLPARGVAIARVKSDSQEFQKLALKFFEERIARGGVKL